MTLLTEQRSECEEIVRRLWPHLDGALSDTERSRVMRHLEECAACRSHYDFAGSFLEAVRTSGPADDEFSALRVRVTQAVAEASGQ